MANLRDRYPYWVDVVLVLIVIAMGVTALVIAWRYIQGMS